MSYGVKNVVAGFGKISEDEIIPYSIERTIIERDQLSKFMDNISCRDMFTSAMDFGCGYGRMLSLLQEKAVNVYGIERDDKLRAIAKKLHPDVHLFSWHERNTFMVELGITYTFLQHLKDGQELEDHCDAIASSIGSRGLLILVEETKELEDEKTTGRTVLKYHQLFPEFELLGSEPRVLEAGNPNQFGGELMAFRKRA